MVKMNGLSQEPDSLTEKELESIARVIHSGWWVLGNEVQEFERQWADYCGCSSAIGVGNGMDAIEIGLRALKIGPGNEVITTAMTAFATVLAILRAGATPVLADIIPETGIISPISAARCITARTKAIIVVHLYGQTAPLDEFQQLCNTKGIHLVEDCAQAHGARFRGKSVGSFGSFGAWSFYPTKNLGTIGDGGAITTSDPGLAKTARQMRNYGQSERYHHPLIGLNSRLDELHAALLQVRLPSLATWNNRRRDIASAYHKGISSPHVRLLPLPRDPSNHVHHLFVITSPCRDRLMAHLRDNNIESLIHYPVPIHHQPPTNNLSRDPEGLGQTEMHASECISLPCYPFLNDHEVETVISAVNQFGG